MPDNSQSELSYQPATKAHAFATSPLPKPVDPTSGQKKKPNVFLLLALETAGLITVFIVLLLILNYFNIISISSIYPNQLGFLPHQNSNLTVICPVPEGCQGVTPIGESQETYSINLVGFFIQRQGPKTTVLAAIAGKLITQSEFTKGKTITKVTIENVKAKSKVEYIFSNISNNSLYIPLISSGTVSTGQKIGTIKDNHFIFDLQDTAYDEYVRTRISKDGKYVENY
jgi:hypothetical protein